MKIIQMNDCDWWIGESLEACVKDYRGNIEEDPVFTEDARELTDEELDRLVFIDADDEGDPIQRTFREQLAVEIERGGAFPRMFGSTEY